MGIGPMTTVLPRRYSTTELQRLNSIFNPYKVTVNSFSILHHRYFFDKKSCDPPSARQPPVLRLGPSPISLNYND